MKHALGLILVSSVLLLGASLAGTPPSAGQVQGSGYVFPVFGVGNLVERAQHGDSRAALDLAVKYFNGIDVPQDYVESKRWFEQAALSGDPEAHKAECALGEFYFAGFGVDKNEPISMFWFRKAAEHGSIKAQGIMAVTHLEGHGVPKDYIEASKWYRKAAEQGDYTSQNDLASLYAQGKGVPKNEQMASQWFRKSAEQGYAPAQATLSARYAAGVGVPKDYIQAYKWLNLAASQDSQYTRDRNALEKRMNNLQIKEAQRLSRAWLRLHPHSPREVGCWWRAAK